MNASTIKPCHERAGWEAGVDAHMVILHRLAVGTVDHVEDHVQRAVGVPTLPGRRRASSMSPVSAMEVTSG